MRRATVTVAAVVGLLFATGCATAPRGDWTPAPVGEPISCTDLKAGKVPTLPTLTPGAELKPVPNLPPGFLQVKYYGTRAGDDVRAVGLHIADAEHGVTVAFYVTLPGVPSNWKDQLDLPDPKGVPKEWFQFFTALRKYRYLKPGGILCRNNAACGMSPDVPPPDVAGVASSGSGGIFGLLPGEPSERYAQLSAPPNPPTATDALPPSQSSNAALVAKAAQNLCAAVALLRE